MNVHGLNKNIEGDELSSNKGIISTMFDALNKAENTFNNKKTINTPTLIYIILR
tara:strand:+ start:46 stop:207 length:162 start_codon:yes stop_codon:yes gene_type:complete